MLGVHCNGATGYGFSAGNVYWPSPAEFKRYLLKIMATKTTELRKALETKTRDELNVLGRRLNIANYRRLTKEQLVETLFTVPSLPKQMQVSWWDLHHNHVYGLATILALVLSIIFYVWPLISPPILAS